MPEILSGHNTHDPLSVILEAQRVPPFSDTLSDRCAVHFPVVARLCRRIGNFEEPNPNNDVTGEARQFTTPYVDYVGQKNPGHALPIWLDGWLRQSPDIGGELEERIDLIYLIRGATYPLIRVSPEGIKKFLPFTDRERPGGHEDLNWLMSIVRKMAEAFPAAPEKKL